jgi:uncharacterized protein YecT (DUF1311 family)
MVMRMKPYILLAVLVVATALPSAAQLEDADATTQSKCREYLKTSLPPESAQAAKPAKWPECNSYKSYSGLGTEVDDNAARKCAWEERLATQADLEPKYTLASVFGGSAMLATLYANGEGVERNIPLALRFACEEGWAPAEFSARIEHLESMRVSTGEGAGKFSYCDDITSGAMEGYCAAYFRELAEQDRAKTLNAIPALFTPAQRDAFSALVTSEQAYALAHGKGEIDLSGTARAMYEIDAEQTLRDDFLAAVQSFESGRYPSGSAATFADADTRLNLAYKNAVAYAEAHKSDYGAVQPDGIRDAERAWLKYRDAWVAFAKLRYPAVPAEAWLTLLTKDRTSILDGSFCDMDAIANGDPRCAHQGDTYKPRPLP